MGLLYKNSARCGYNAQQAATQHIRRGFIKLAVVLLVSAEAAGVFVLYNRPAVAGAAAVVSVPACSPSSYTQPATPAASPDQPGLHTTILPPARYAVYGSTAAQINNQMAACSPVGTKEGDGRFAASTDYAIAWAYDYQDDGGGMCRLSDVSVTLTVSQIYPAWQSTSGTEQGITANWQRFISGLQTHESGHARLDRTAAVNLLSDLQNFSATDCASIAVAANMRAQADLAALNQANDNYDTATDHGTTQGAVLR